MPPRSRSQSPLLPIIEEAPIAVAERGVSHRRWRKMRTSCAPGVALVGLLLLMGWVSKAQNVQLFDAQSQAFSAQSGGNSGADDMSHYVQVQGGRFVVNCKQLFVRGWNQWELVEAAAGALELFGASLPPNTTGPALVRHILDRAVANRFNLMRAWAHTVSPQYALQTSPGQYNDAIFQGLDYALDEARKRGIRVLLSLTDNWQQTGGADEFVRWAGAGSHEAFFSDPRAKQLYKNHVAKVLNRVNTINGRRYSQDPTIFGWNLINEPRCYQCGGTLAQWVGEMAAYVKSLDANHLLTVGEEGFNPAGVAQAAANPQGANSWAADEGQNFVADHAYHNIDFMSIHLWMNNWEDKTQAFAQRWIQQHISDAQDAGKPLLMEEFGVWNGNPQEQQLYYNLIYNAIEQSARAGGPAQGAAFWTWYSEGQKAPAEEGGAPGGLFGIFESESGIWSLISGFSNAMASLSGSQLASCSDAGSTVAAPADCSSTWVNGAQGTGYEGPQCSIDINECVRGTANCDANAACTNTAGSFTCRCFDGYSGDGYSCQAAAQLAQVQAAYVTDGPARLACNEGQDIAYPPGAPGFQYDVTGALDRVQGGNQKNGYGSRTAVEPISCMLACDAAPGCDSFSYNPAQKRCFLKAGSGRQTCGAAPTVCVSARGKTYSCGVWQTYFKQGNSSAGTSAVQLLSGSSSATPNTSAGQTTATSVDAANRASQQLAAAFKKP